MVGMMSWRRQESPERRYRVYRKWSNRKSVQGTDFATKMLH